MVDNWLSRLWVLYNVIINEIIILFSFSNEMLYFLLKIINNCLEFFGFERENLLFYLYFK